MRPSLLLLLLLMGAEIAFGDTHKAVLTLEPNWTQIFVGETISLTCSTEGEDADEDDEAYYCWYKTDKEGGEAREIVQWTKDKSHTISSSVETDSGTYTCKISNDGSYSKSNAISLTVKEGIPRPVLSSDREPVFTGNTVTLRCDMGQSTGWRFYWYRNTQTSDPVAQADGNSYSIISDKVSDGGQYWCRARRGDPVYHTQYSDAVEIKVTVNPKAVATPLSNWTNIFIGETLALRCDIQGEEHNDWQYSWDKNRTSLEYQWQNYTIYFALESHSGDYSCRGTQRRDSQTSEISEAVRVTVSEKPNPVLRGPSQTWLTEGDSVTLSCEVRGSTTGWRFHWYKTAPYSPELVYVLHENRRYYLQLVSDSISGAGGSYTLSPAALRHTGVYVCRAERGEPAYHTEFSQPQPLWVTGLSPPSSVVVSPNTTQHFTLDSLSLSCERSGNSTGWRLMWFSKWTVRDLCPSAWTSETGSTCSRRSASSSDGGVYWCQSESGEKSNPVNITVHNGDVILESPTHPVTEGDPLTLRCRYRYKPSNISADFYKDGTLLQTSTTGEMTIPAVSESHEGVYRCRNPEKGESPESWVTVRVSVSDSGYSKLAVVGAVVGVMIIFIIGTTLSLMYCFKKKKASPGPQTPLPSLSPTSGQQQQNPSHSPDQSLSAGHEGQQGYELLHSASVYDAINTAERYEEDDATAGPSDVTYSTIDQKSTSENVKRKKQKRGGGQPEPEIFYSELKAVKTAGEEEAEQSEPTYAQVIGKKVKGTERV
ncbi:Fc receptor-like protein 5 isoform X1 [Clupea harengus]|uniref:Fc receptor-like protein 5 isoform X1 n=1 Tax=Clupea harengus TaxID=7950 RepID=A0A6P8GNM7_CLUHA|nr:Fc receptor-like protein 5 isoform X1 [Clupea harengus]